MLHIVHASCVIEPCVLFYGRYGFIVRLGLHLDPAHVFCNLSK